MEDSPQPISRGNNADPHGVCGAAVAVQRNKLQSFLHLMYHVINLKQKKY